MAIVVTLYPNISISEKLLTSEGRELRRTLFSLKQIFQDDKDLVHAFVALGGLNSLILVGNDADQNYQNYILRALGQVSSFNFKSNHLNAFIPKKKEKKKIDAINEIQKT